MRMDVTPVVSEGAPPEPVTLRRRVVLIAEDEDGTRLSFAIDGLGLDGSLTNQDSPLSNGWSALVEMHSKWCSERPLGDYEWSTLPIGDDG